MPILRLPPHPVAITALLSLLMAGCASTPAPDHSQQLPATAEFCDSYLAYQMCVRDVDSDGEVDLMYFADSQEIFMLAPEYKHAKFPNLSLHRCIQPMDTAMRSASSELLYINDDTNLLTKTQLKTRLLLNYSRYLPTISHCMGDNNIAGNGEDDFGDDDFGEEDFDAL